MEVWVTLAGGMVVLPVAIFLPIHQTVSIASQAAKNILLAFIIGLPSLSILSAVTMTFWEQKERLVRLLAMWTLGLILPVGILLPIWIATAPAEVGATVLAFFLFTPPVGVLAGILCLAITSVDPRLPFWPLSYIWLGPWWWEAGYALLCVGAPVIVLVPIYFANLLPRMPNTELIVYAGVLSGLLLLLFVVSFCRRKGWCCNRQPLVVPNVYAYEHAAPEIPVSHSLLSPGHVAATEPPSYSQVSIGDASAATMPAAMSVPGPGSFDTDTALAMRIAPTTSRDTRSASVSGNSNFTMMTTGSSAAAPPAPRTLSISAGTGSQVLARGAVLQTVDPAYYQGAPPTEGTFSSRLATSLQGMTAREWLPPREGEAAHDSWEPASLWRLDTETGELVPAGTAGTTEIVVRTPNQPLSQGGRHVVFSVQVKALPQQPFVLKWPLHSPEEHTKTALTHVLQRSQLAQSCALEFNRCMGTVRSGAPGMTFAAAYVACLTSRLSCVPR
jgi:hypothetical protein